jgi:FtsZ-interacting cell division protein ZipA
MEIELRIILLIVGVIILVVVGIDLYRRRPIREDYENYTDDNAQENSDIEPAVDTFYVDTKQLLKRELDIEPIVTHEPSYAHEVASIQQMSATDYIPEAKIISELSPPSPMPENILTITIRSRDSYGFKGADLLSAIKSAHLHFGKNEVFYRYEHENGDGEALFTLVKATEPGYFYLETLLKEHVPGVILILVTDQVSNPRLALDKMVRTAKQMAFALNAELLDQHRQPLTLETIEQYKRQTQAK